MCLSMLVTDKTPQQKNYDINYLLVLNILFLLTLFNFRYFVTFLVNIPTQSINYI